MAVEIRKEQALEPFKDVLDILAPYPADKYHRLVPTAFQQRSPLYAPALQIVKVNADDTRDVYATPGSRDGTVCLHTQALERIGNAIGIDFGPTRFDLHEKYWLTAIVPFWVIDALGQRRRGTASKTLDLRDGAIQANLLGGGLQAARQFIYERAEAGARSRVVKKWTGMPTSFTKDELAKPFVALRWTLDVNQPDVRKALIDAGVNATRNVFGEEGAPLELGDGEDDDRPAPAPVRAAVIDVPRPTKSVADEPGADDDPEPTSDIDAVRVIVRKRTDAGRDTTPAPDEQLDAVLDAIRDVCGLRSRRLSGEQKKTLRLAVLRAMFGSIKTSREITRAGALTVLAMAKDSQGQRQIQTAFAWAVKNDPTASEFADGLAAAAAAL